MRLVFPFIFLLVGLPIIFALEVLLGIDKGIGTMLIASILIFGFKLHKTILTNKILFLMLIIFTSFLILLFFADHYKTKQIISLCIIIYLIFLAGQPWHISEKKFLIFTYLISSISIIFIYLSTPLSLSYWILHGGRLYIGETNNPNLVSWVAFMNIIASIYILFKIPCKIFEKLAIIGFLPFALYIYFLSFSKSTILGLILILLFYLFKKRLIKFIFSKNFFIMLFIFAIILFFISSKIDMMHYAKSIFNAFNSLLYGSNTNMSASIRYENFKYFFENYNNFQLIGYGINTFRPDSPLIQIYIDLGLILAIMMFFISIIIPLKIILSKRHFTLIEEFIVLVYLFYLPNLFFHGTPYEWSTWLSIILFYGIFKKGNNYV